ncbi:hypothetical protein LEMLEM_LOCUS23994 [Lemmus lemmus]
MISAPPLLQCLRFLLMVNGLRGRDHHNTQPWVTTVHVHTLSATQHHTSL